MMPIFLYLYLHIIFLFSDPQFSCIRMVREFIEGWDLVQVLGEGTFGEVKLLVSKENGEACAIKEVNTKALLYPQVTCTPLHPCTLAPSHPKSPPCADRPGLPPRGRGQREEGDLCAQAAEAQARGAVLRQPVGGQATVHLPGVLQRRRALR